MAIDLDAEMGGKKGRTKPEMNVTPLVDVVLVLLIIFMVVMPAMHRLFWVHVPPDDAAEPSDPPTDSEPPIVVTVNAGGQLRINQDVVSDREFPGRLRRALVARGERKIYFDADDDAPFERAVAAMDLARGAGAANIAVVTKPLR